VSDEIIKVMKTGGDFVHGYTYSGHPVSAAVALRNIEIMEREGLVEKVRSETGPYLAKALATLNDHPLVGEARSIGLLGAVEIVADKATVAPALAARKAPPARWCATSASKRPDGARHPRQHRDVPATDHHYAADRRPCRHHPQVARRGRTEAARALKG
jgi:adenosylmethionine-8-amino-7-oxononanoate aminotransferase